jgi:6-phospho-beta-glucosidase
MKIAVIGGGSTYTPEPIEGFASRANVLPVDELVLQDIAANRLDIVGGLARRILARTGHPARLLTTTSLDDAVDGAAAVLVQLCVGGQHARLVDETLPGRFGLIGQETTGPGGFAKGLRTVPVVLDIAAAVAKRALPGAWIVDFTTLRSTSSPAHCSTPGIVRWGCAMWRSACSAGSRRGSACRPSGSASTTPG